jgi:enoyl-CoA hydratase/carnithine racemase
MSFDLIRYERTGAAGVVTLNRPERLNAYTPAMRVEIIAALAQAEADPQVRAVVFTGAGRGFCAGMDLTAGAGAPVEEPPSRYDHLPGEGRMVMTIHDLAKPVIAAINGHALGAGAAMTLPMDIRLASTEAKIGFPFARLGFVPEMASAWFLPRLVGPSVASEWLCTGRTLTAEEAFAGGLVREVLAPDALLPRALQLAEEIAQASPVSVAMTRRMIQRFAALDGPDAALRLDGPLVRARVAAGDAREAMAARSEKRAPVFPDRLDRDVLGAMGLD